MLTHASHHAGQGRRAAAGAVDAVVQRVGYPALVVVLRGVGRLLSNRRGLLRGSEEQRGGLKVTKTTKGRKKLHQEIALFLS